MGFNRLGWLTFLGLFVASLVMPSVFADDHDQGRGGERGRGASAQVNGDDGDDDLEPTFDLKNFCVTGLSGDVMTIAGGGVTLDINVGDARGNLRSRLRGDDDDVTSTPTPGTPTATATGTPTATSTATATSTPTATRTPTATGTPGTGGTDRVVGHLVRVKGIIDGGVYWADNVNLKNRDCEGNVTEGTATPTPTPTATSTPGAGILGAGADDDDGPGRGRGRGPQSADDEDSGPGRGQGRGRGND